MDKNKIRPVIKIQRAIMGAIYVMYGILMLAMVVSAVRSHL